MFASISRDGLYVVFRERSAKREALGFVIKWNRYWGGGLFSERYGGYRHAFNLGPFYFRTYALKPITPPLPHPAQEQR